MVQNLHIYRASLHDRDTGHIAYFLHL